MEFASGRVGRGRLPEETDVPRLRRRSWPYIVPLLIQNLIVYAGHYFGNVGFPWDFSMSYYAMVAFWTTAVGQGVYPQWLPFQQTGYPFALQLQSGIDYLPFWLFPLTTIPYTLHAAIVFQCLHVFAGSIGMFVLARQLFGSRKYALIAAVGFQFFGGFYSNAEHPDIVRAYACSPWLLYVFSVDVTRTARLPGRTLLVPWVVYLFLTGAYPGNVISAGVIVPVFVALQLVDARMRGAEVSLLAHRAASLGGLALLGVGMAFVHLAPVWLCRDLYFRGQPLDVPRIGLWLEHLPGLFLSNRTLPGEISMTSTYISMPLLMMAAFTPRRALTRHWIYALLAGVAAIMAAGDHLAVSPLLRSMVSAFGLSRFPSSDYRVFIAISLILFATFGLRAVVERQLGARSFAIRSGLCVACVLWGSTRVYVPFSSETLRVVAVMLASLGACLTFWSRGRPLRLAGLVVVVGLISADAARVLPDMESWHQSHIDDYYSQQRWPPYTRNRGRRLVASGIFRNSPATRPARIEPRGLVRWAGYSDGRYYTTDLTPNVLRATQTVASNPLYREYMLREWLPVLLTANEADAAAADKGISIGLAGAATDEGGTVRQTSYRVNDITYEVALTQPRTLVENEMYFPGWRARLSTPGGDVIDATATNAVFRAWRLPPGIYTMTAHFEFPHLWALRTVSGASFAVWLIACARRLRVARETPLRTAAGWSQPPHPI